MNLKHVLVFALALTLSSNLYAQASCPTARGGAVLAALRPGFPVRGTIDMLSASPHPAIGVVHKAFGNRYENLRRIITGLLRTSECVTVVVYVECGPCRAPRRPAGLFPVIAPHLTISALNRHLSRGNLRTLNAFRKQIAFVQTQLPQLPGVRYILLPGLEDNFTSQSVTPLVRLLEQEFSLRDDWTLARNRLDGGEAPRGLRREIHTYDQRRLASLDRGDIVSGDGYTLCLPTDRRCQGYSLAQVARLVRDAEDRGVIVLLWRPEWQGLPPLIPGTVRSLVPPSRRRYSLAGKVYIKQLLSR